MTDKEYTLEDLENHETEEGETWDNSLRVIHRIYQELFEEADPGMNYARVVIEEGPREGTPWYQLHFLDQDRQSEIIEEHVEDLPGYQQKKIKTTVNLGHSPAVIKEEVNKKRKAEGLEPIEE